MKLWCIKSYKTKDEKQNRNLDSNCQVSKQDKVLCAPQINLNINAIKLTRTNITIYPISYNILLDFPRHYPICKLQNFVVCLFCYYNKDHLTS